MKYILLIFFTTLSAFLIQLNVAEDSFLSSPYCLILFSVLVLGVFLVRFHQISRQQMPGELFLNRIDKNIQEELAYILTVPILLLVPLSRNMDSYSGYSIFIIPLTFLSYEFMLKVYSKKYRPYAISIDQEFIYRLGTWGIKKYPLNTLLKISYNRNYRAINFSFEEGLYNFKLVFNDFSKPDLLNFYSSLKQVSIETLVVEEELELYMELMQKKNL
ncbi:MAG: hypothetical protein CFE21_15320 [Bacteroidetes bacterium B1(2017)]|nr:MAG: hypothetical protein CFE21_15320 [Bacteroidetes bacterium B1(2017)]